MSSVNSAISEKHICQLCGYQTLKKTQLRLHAQALHDGTKFQCQECEYQATQKGHLQTNHKTVHTGQKFQCQECEFRQLRKEGRIRKSDFRKLDCFSLTF